MITTSILIGAVFILTSVWILTKLRVKNLKLFDWFQVEFWPYPQKKYYVRSLDKFGFVISKDDQIYKLHLKTTFKGKEETSLNNAQLFIAGIGWFVIRLFFSEQNGSRMPINPGRIYAKDIVCAVNFEFEPKDGWVPLRLRVGEYKCLLRVCLVDSEVKHKFVFQVRQRDIQNLKNMSAQRNGTTPTVIEVPIIRN